MFFIFRPSNIFLRFLIGMASLVAALGTLPAIVEAKSPLITDAMVIAEQECSPSMSGVIEIRHYGHGGIAHEGILYMNGCTGKMLTSFFDTDTNQTQTVEQTMVLRSTKYGLVWLGYDPIYQDTRVPAKYNADNITMRRAVNGEWEVVNCDDANVCSEVEVISYKNQQQQMLESLEEVLEVLEQLAE